MKNKLNWQQAMMWNGWYCFVYVNGLDLEFIVNVDKGIAYSVERFANRRVATVRSKKGADHLKDKIVERTIEKLQAEVDALREITGMGDR
jgi:hypothetical protein